VLQQLNISAVKVVWANDDLEELKTALAQALLQSDLVLLTGGISAGDYDFVLEAATECEVQKLFHKVKQRPGKPLYFGMKKNTPVFGLPGNPSSVLTCFYQYVIPALGKLSNTNKALKTIKAPLAKPFRKAPGLTHFLKGFFDDQTALPLEAQESYRLKSFAKANCLIQIDEEVTEYKEGEMVKIHLLPV
jgi:molybdopterin molybdotransferase